MSDIKRLLLNRIEDDLTKLEKTGVGHIDMTDSDGILYSIDDRKFIVDVKEYVK